MATTHDAFIPRCPERPYDLLAHEFPGYVHTTDLGPALSTINIDNDLTSTLAPPLTHPSDPRWAWKITELHRLQALQPSLAVVLGET